MGAPTYETRTSVATVRHNGSCRRCGRAHTALVTRTVASTRRSDQVREQSRKVTEKLADGTTWRGVECCGSHVSMRPVKGIRRDEIVCGSKCTGSKGHVCECSCGGRNHGAGASV